MSHPATHREPNPPPKLTQNPPQNPLRPTAQKQKSSSKSTKPHQLQTTSNTETHHRKHHNPKLAITKPNSSRSGILKKKTKTKTKKPSSCDRCDKGISATLRSVRQGGSGWLGTSWGREKASREREREQRTGRHGWGWLGTVRKRAESEKRAETVRKRESREGVK